MSELIGMAGSPGTMIAYLLTGLIIVGVMRSLAELVSCRPVAGALIDYPDTFVDEALGFSTGVSYWLAQCVSMATMTASAARQFNNFVADGNLSNESECGIIIGLCVITLLSNIVSPF